MLTPEQAYRFDLHGYLHLRGVFSPQLCAALKDRLKMLEGRSTEDLPDGVFASATAVVNEYRIYNVIGCGGPFEELIDHPEIMPWVEEFVPKPYRLCEAYSVTRREGIGIPLHSLWQSEYGLTHKRTPG